MRKKDKKIINIKVILSISLFLVLTFMSVGYASLKQSLYVSSVATITTPEYSIEVQSVSVSATNQGSYQSSNPSYNGSEVALYSTLPNVNSSIIYTVSIKNKGLTSGVLDYTFSNLDNNNVQYKIGGISNGKVLAPMESVNVTIELSYWDNVTSVSSANVSSLFNFEFIPYNSSYSNNCTLSWNGSTTAQPAVRSIYGVNYYEISNANEFAWYANYINNTSNSANAILTNDICLNSKPLQQIGTNNFTGILDGQNRNISGYYHSNNISIEKGTTTTYAGLFKQNSGIIKNLNLKGSINEITYAKPSSGVSSNTPKIYEHVGAISSINDGKIINSSFTGSISGTFESVTNCYAINPVQRNYVAGIVANNTGIVSGCINKGTFNLKVTGSPSACTYKREARVNVGGVVAVNSGYVTDSYNNSNLSVSADMNRCEYYLWYGGIIGDMESGKIINSYNSGTLTHNDSTKNATKHYYTGGAVGESAGTISNTYYLNTCGFSGSNGTSVSSNDLSNLNISIGNYYTKDTGSINGGYPILKWQ